MMSLKKWWYLIAAAIIVVLIVTYIVRLIKFRGADNKDNQKEPHLLSLIVALMFLLGLPYLVKGSNEIFQANMEIGSQFFPIGGDIDKHNQELVNKLKPIQISLIKEIDKEKDPQKKYELQKEFDQNQYWITKADPVNSDLKKAAHEVKDQK